MDNLKLSRATRPNNDQKLHLIQFLEEHIDLANDKYESSYDGAHERSRQWDHLAIELNALNGANKTGEKWRKYWQDQRSYVKERNAIINAARVKTGVHTKIKELSDYEKRVTALITAQAIEGDIEVAEFGDNEIIEIEVPVTYILPSLENSTQASTSQARATEIPVELPMITPGHTKQNIRTPRAIRPTLSSKKRRYTNDDDQMQKYLEFENKKFVFEKEYKLQKLDLMKKQIEAENAKTQAINNLCDILKENRNEK